jgi:hypothetical protein
MEQHTMALRQWLDANGHGSVPLDINEFGAGNGVTAGIRDWGMQAATYTQWALCTPALKVENVQAFWWGAIPNADADPWFSMFTSELAETPLGSAYLGEARTLTSQGCPTPQAVAPARTPATETATTMTGKCTHGSGHKRRKTTTHKRRKMTSWSSRRVSGNRPSHARKNCGRRPGGRGIRHHRSHDMPGNGDRMSQGPPAVAGGPWRWGPAWRERARRKGLV